MVVRCSCGLRLSLPPNRHHDRRFSHREAVAARRPWCCHHLHVPDHHRLRPARSRSPHRPPLARLERLVHLCSMCKYPLCMLLGLCSPLTAVFLQLVTVAYQAINVTSKFLQLLPTCLNAARLTRRRGLGVLICGVGFHFAEIMQQYGLEPITLFLKVSIPRLNEPFSNF